MGILWLGHYCQVRWAYRLLVNQNHAPEIISTSPTTVVLGQTYRYDVRATDADGDALSYGLNQGALAKPERQFVSIAA